MEKLIAHTENYFLLEKESTTRAINWGDNTPISEEAFHKAWEAEREFATHNITTHNPALLSGWSLFGEENSRGGVLFKEEEINPNIEVFRVSITSKEGGNPLGKYEWWFTGGYKNCKCFISIFLKQNGDIFLLKWDFVIRPYRNYKARKLTNIIRENYQKAGDNYFLSRDTSDYNLYTGEMIIKKHQKELEFPSSIFPQSIHTPI